MRYSLGGSMGLAWPEVRAKAQLAEDLGFEEFLVSDHLQAVDGYEPEAGCLDAVALVCALASVTSSVRLGCLVSPVTTRHAVPLVRALQTADVLSGGRIIVGLGAGWDAEEHRAFGLPFPPLRERFDLLRGTIATMERLWDGADSPLRPRPVQHPFPLLLAGASDAAVALAAEKARQWNVVGTPAFVESRVRVLRAQERHRVEASVVLPTFLFDDQDRIEEVRASLLAPRAKSQAQARSALPDEPPRPRGFVGRPEELPETVAEYAEAGADRLIVSIYGTLDETMLRRAAAALGPS